MVISEAIAEHAASLLRADQPERLTGDVLWQALRRAESALDRSGDAEGQVCIPPYVRASQRPTDDFRPTRYDASGCVIRETYDPREWVAVPGGLCRRDDPMDDPRYVHGLGR